MNSTLKTFLITFLFFISLSGFKCKPDNMIENITYQNIVIFSDLSTRVPNGFAKNDLNDINMLIDIFLKCVNPGNKIDDRSAIVFCGLNKEKPIRIDVGNFEDINDKQLYVNNKGKFKNSGLSYDILKFRKYISQVYSTKNCIGSDMLSNLLNRIESSNIVKLNKSLPIGEDDTLNCFYENHFYLLTDGYPEYKNGKEFYFGDKQIKKIRKYCKETKKTISKALEEKPELGMQPVVKKEIHKNIILHILETTERDYINNRYITDIGLHDNEILKEVWSKWARESGFKPYSNKDYLEWKTFNN
jgi:hypothetical protein